VRVKDSYILARRGGCSFSLKTLAAQRAGAIGVLIANTEKTTMRMMVSAHTPTKRCSTAIPLSIPHHRLLSIACDES
jgi:PA domain